MKRLLLSLVGGFVIPFLYACVAGPLSTYTDDPRLQTLLVLPLRWPRHLYVYLSPPPKPSLYFDDTASLVALILCDVALYAGVTYLLLTLRALSKRRTSIGPPPPPDAAATRPGGVDSPRGI
ncbi:MAG TPA: hypothetical protein VGV38_01030 [Pyrinomonadaceae bacterium]|nr:hypothetical protein [Pyrinomonadaceae bacterium]